MLLVRRSLAALRRLAPTPGGSRGIASLPDWRHSRPSADGTHHVAAGMPLYAARFEHVLPFHEPGLAPGKMPSSGWCHVNAAGQPLSNARFHRAFGFYESKAAVTARLLSHTLLLLLCGCDAMPAPRG
jgi:hypothetical protein